MGGFSKVFRDELRIEISLDELKGAEEKGVVKIDRAGSDDRRYLGCDELRVFLLGDDDLGCDGGFAYWRLIDKSGELFLFDRKLDDLVDDKILALKSLIRPELEEIEYNLYEKKIDISYFHDSIKEISLYEAGSYLEDEGLGFEIEDEYLVNYLDNKMKKIEIGVKSLRRDLDCLVKRYKKEKSKVKGALKSEVDMLWQLEECIKLVGKINKSNLFKNE